MSTKSKYTLVYTVKDLLTLDSENQVLVDSPPIEAYNRFEAIKRACQKLEAIEIQLDGPQEWPLEEPVREDDKNDLKPWYAQLRNAEGTRRYNLLYRGELLVHPRSGEKIKSLNSKEREELDRMLGLYSEKKQ